MQGVATIAPSFAILASFVFTVSLAGIVTPWAYLLAGSVLLLTTGEAAFTALVPWLILMAAVLVALYFYVRNTSGKVQHG